MAKPIKVFTIGFTQKSAQKFFELLINSGVNCVIDTRLNNVSQLAGFTKKQDLEYFLDVIGNIKYIHLPQLAPTKQILDDYKKNGGSWSKYEERFLNLMTDRKIEDTVSSELVASGCLLCSEPTPHHCHRRLVAEYLQGKWSNLSIQHL